MNRREAREQAFALIFEQSFNHDSIAYIIDNASLSRDIEVADFAKKVATGVEMHEDVINQKIEQYIRTWKMNRLSKVTLSLLRLAIYEMMFEQEIPISVSINEAVDLAKKYGGNDDAPFINGVLGSVAKELDKEDA